jgi:hypothetical protein
MPASPNAVIEIFYPELAPPLILEKVKSPVGYTGDLDMYPGTLYFNASMFLEKQGLKISSLLEQNATKELLRGFQKYYMSTCGYECLSLVVVVNKGPKAFWGYYIHMSLHDAVTRWCKSQGKLKDPEPRRFSRSLTPQGRFARAVRTITAANLLRRPSRTSVLGIDPK